MAFLKIDVVKNNSSDINTTDFTKRAASRNLAVSWCMHFTKANQFYFLAPRGVNRKAESDLS